MKQFETINILDMIGAIGETKLKQRLSEFSCPVNPEIERFVMDHAIEFAKKKLSVTYFVINENGKIIAGTTNKEKTAFIDTEKTMLEMASSPAFHGQNTRNTDRRLLHQMYCRESQYLLLPPSDIVYPAYQLPTAFWPV